MSSALIIIDLIQDIVGPKGRINQSRTQSISRNILEHSNTVAAYARVRKIPVIWVRIGFEDDYHDIPAHSPLFNKIKILGALRLNNGGTQWIEGLDVQEQDKIVIKKGVSAFAGNDLLEWLKKHHYYRLLLGGVSSNMAIESTARQAHDLGFQVTVLEDLCAAATLESHQLSMENLTYLAEVMTSEQWMNG